MPHPLEAAVVRDITAKVAAGASLGSLVRELHEAGFRTSRGNGWSHVTLRQVVLRESNRGVLVEETVWLAARRALTAPGRHRGPSNAKRWLLSGIARCGVCDATLKSGVKGDGQFIYSCRVSSSHVAPLIGPIDGYVTEVIIERLSRSDAQAALALDPQEDTGLVAWERKANSVAAA